MKHQSPGLGHSTKRTRHREFAGLKHRDDRWPDESTIRRICHALETLRLTEEISSAVGHLRGPAVALRRESSHHRGHGQRADAQRAVHDWQRRRCGRVQRAVALTRGPHSGQDRTAGWGYEATGRPCKGMPPEACKEHGAAAHTVRAYQSVDGRSLRPKSVGMHMSENSKSRPRSGSKWPFHTRVPSNGFEFKAPARRLTSSEEHA